MDLVSEIRVLKPGEIAWQPLGAKQLSGGSSFPTLPSEDTCRLLAKCRGTSRGKVVGQPKYHNHRVYVGYKLPRYGHLGSVAMPSLIFGPKPVGKGCRRAQVLHLRSGRKSLNLKAWR